MALTKKHGVRHIDRLIDAMLSFVEDDNNDVKDRIDAGKLAAELMGKRQVGKKKTREEKSIAAMLGTSKSKKS